MPCSGALWIYLEDSRLLLLFIYCTLTVAPLIHNKLATSFRSPINHNTIITIEDNKFDHLLLLLLLIIISINIQPSASKYTSRMWEKRIKLTSRIQLQQLSSLIREKVDPKFSFHFRFSFEIERVLANARYQMLSLILCPPIEKLSQIAWALFWCYIIVRKQCCCCCRNRQFHTNNLIDLNLSTWTQTRQNDMGNRVINLMMMMILYLSNGRLMAIIICL